MGGEGMGTGADDKRAHERPNPVEPVDLENPYPSPIVVSGGKGSYLRLPTPGTVVEGLGGSSRLNQRLGTILASGSYLSGRVGAHDAVALTAHYDEFFQLLEVISYPTPIHADPSGGWSVTIPIPETVVEDLGGSSRLNERLASMYVSAPRAPAGVDPVTAVRLTAHYDRLLGQIETVIDRLES
jgi:hypothetical protein